MTGGQSSPEEAAPRYAGIRTFARLASLVKDAEIASIQEGAPLT